MELINFIIEWFNWWMTPGIFDPGTFDPVQKAFWPVALAGLAMSAYGMYKKNQADNELQAKQEGVNQRYSDLTDWYEGESSKDFLDTEVAQSTLGNIREKYKEALETGDNNAAKGGLTAESKVAQKGVLQEKYNDVLRNLTGYGTQYKQNLKRDYSGSLSKLYGSNQSTYGPESESWGNFMNNANGVTSSAIETTDWDKIFSGSAPAATGDG